MATPGRFGCILIGTRESATLKSAGGCSEKSTRSGFGMPSSRPCSSRVNTKKR